MELTSTGYGKRVISSRGMQTDLSATSGMSRLLSGTGIAPYPVLWMAKEVSGDEPEQYGGKGSDITPEDMLLRAIGGCFVATYIGGLSPAGITVKSLRLDVSSRVNFRAACGLEAANPGFESIRVAVDIQTDSSTDKVKGILSRAEYPWPSKPASIHADPGGIGR